LYFLCICKYLDLETVTTNFSDSTSETTNNVDNIINQLTKDIENNCTNDGEMESTDLMSLKTTLNDDSLTDQNNFNLDLNP